MLVHPFPSTTKFLAGVSVDVLNRLNIAQLDEMGYVIGWIVIGWRRKVSLGTHKLKVPIHRGMVKKSVIYI